MADHEEGPELAQLHVDAPHANSNRNRNGDKHPDKRDHEGARGHVWSSTQTQADQHR